MPLDKNPSKRSVVVGMSGGIDSTVAALILADQGYSVVGVSLKFYCYTRAASTTRPCCSDDLLRRARSFCASRGIHHWVVDVEEPFERFVVKDFISNYRSGRTPNPCIVCNEKVKFPALLDAADKLGCEYVATGHYARIFSGPRGAVFLCVAADESKDQSYFLYRLGGKTLRRLLFPVGELSMKHVRELASRIGMTSEKNRSSQDVCFIPDGDLRRFLEERIGKTPGPILSHEGRELGTHDGIYSATIGQRKRLGVAAGIPLYVYSIDAPKNAIVLAPRDDLFSIGAVCGALKLRTRNLTGPLEAKIRYRCSFARVKEVRLAGSRLEVIFMEPQWALTPGQSLVLYHSGLVVGGGIIQEGIAAK